MNNPVFTRRTRQTTVGTATCGGRADRRRIADSLPRHWPLRFVEWTGLSAWLLILAWSLNGFATQVVRSEDAPKPPPAAESGSSSSRAGNAPLSATEAKDAVLLHNGDTLYGRLQLIDPAGGVRWRHPDASEDIDFSSGSVSEVRFGYRAQPQLISTNSCQVHFSNSDELEGDLIMCDSDRVVLETWYGGKIEIPRKFVRFIAPNAAEKPPIFEGPTGLDGWTMGLVQSVANAGQWSYRNGAFYATQSASIARDVKLPDVASLQFDLNWKGMLYIAIALYTDYMQPINLQNKETGPDFGGFYSMQLNSYTVNLLPVTKLEPLRYLGQTSVPAFNQKTKAHLEIRVNKPKRMIALMVDGLLVRQWIDTEDFVGKGSAIRIVHQGQGSVRVSNIRVAEWDGQFEEKPASTPDSKNDQARLQNGDKVAGSLQQILDGKVTFALPEGAALDIPLKRVKLVEMAGQKMERPQEGQVNVRATFRRGGSISFRLEKWDDQEVVGTSPNFGKLALNPAAFERVQFYPLARAKPTAGTFRGSPSNRLVNVQGLRAGDLQRIQALEFQQRLRILDFRGRAGVRPTRELEPAWR